MDKKARQNKMDKKARQKKIILKWTSIHFFCTINSTDLV